MWTLNNLNLDIRFYDFISVRFQVAWMPWPPLSWKITSKNGDLHGTTQSWLGSQRGLPQPRGSYLLALSLLPNKWEIFSRWVCGAILSRNLDMEIFLLMDYHWIVVQFDIFFSLSGSNLALRNFWGYFRIKLTFWCSWDDLMQFYF